MPVLSCRTLDQRSNPSTLPWEPGVLADYQRSPWYCYLYFTDVKKQSLEGTQNLPKVTQPSVKGRIQAQVCSTSVLLLPAKLGGHEKKQTALHGTARMLHI